jgi:hypothetical protein
MGIDRIDVEGNMEGLVSFGVKIFNGLAHDLSNAELHHMVHRETFDLVFLQVDPLVWVDVTDANEDQIFKRNDVLEPGEAWDAGLGKSSGVASWVTVVAVVCAESGVDEIRVGVDPDDLEILVAAVERMKGGSSDGVVSTHSHHHMFWVFLDSFYNSVVHTLKERVK